MNISLTPRAILRALIVWGLAAAFVTGGVGAISPSSALWGDHARLGYPDQFRPLIGLMEFAAALLITNERTRQTAAAVGGLVMAAWLLTLLIQAAFVQMAAPVAVLIALLALLKLDAKAREVRWECKVF